MKKIFLNILIIALAAIIVMAAIIIFGNDFILTLRLITTAMTVFGTSISAYICAMKFNEKKFRIFSIIGIILSFITFLIITLVIWFEIAFLMEQLVLFIVLTGYFAHTCLLLKNSDYKERQIIASIVIACNTITTLVNLLIIYFDIELLDIIEKINMLLNTAVFFGTIVVIIIDITNKQKIEN